jgi:phospholipid-translocating ATPase
MSSIFKRHPLLSNNDRDDEDPLDNGEGDMIDPELRLRTVRTAASTLAESIRSESRRERWRRRTTSGLKSKTSAGRNIFAWKAQQSQQEPDPRDKPTTASADGAKAKPAGKRRSIYINAPLPPSELDSKGEPIVRYARNKVRTSSKFEISSVLC